MNANYPRLGLNLAAPKKICAAYSTHLRRIIFFCAIFSVQGTNVFGQFTATADDFSTAGALVGSTPDSGVGNWTQIGGTSTSPLTVSGGVLVLAAGSGQSAQLNFNTSDLNTGIIYTGLTVSVASGSISGTSGSISTFFGFRSGTAASGSYEVGLGLFRPNSTAQTAGALSTTTSQFQFGFGSGASLANGGTRWGSVSTVNTSYRIVFAWDLTNDTGQMWVNPTSSSSTSITISSGLTGGTRGIYVRQGAATSGQITLDSLFVSTDFNTAAGIAVPEPSTYAAIIGAVTLVGAGWYRQRSRVNAARA